MITATIRDTHQETRVATVAVRPHCGVVSFAGSLIWLTRDPLLALQETSDVYLVVKSARVLLPDVWVPPNDYTKRVWRINFSDSERWRGRTWLKCASCADK